MHTTQDAHRSQALFSGPAEKPPPQSAGAGVGIKRLPSWFWLLPILCLICWLGARGLNADSLWYDEWWSVYSAGGTAQPAVSLADFFERNRQQGWQPPLYSVVLAAWLPAVGPEPPALRALSLLTGLLAVACCYRFACSLEPDPARRWVVGLVAAAVLGLSAFYTFYLHEIRTYALLALFSVLMPWAYLALQRPPRPTLTRHLALAFSTAGLLYSHFFGALLLGGIGLYHLLFTSRSGRWLRPFPAWLIGTLLFAPWAGVALTSGGTRVDPVLAANVLAPDQIVARVLFMFSNGNSLLLLILIATALRVPTGRMLAFWGSSALAVVLIGSQAVPVFSEIRYLIWLWPLLAALTGLGLSRLTLDRRWLALALGGWGLVSVWLNLNALPLLVAFHAPDADTYNHSYAGAFRTVPWQQMRDTLRTESQLGDALALHRPDAIWAIQGPFDYYTESLPLRRTILEALPGDETDETFDQTARAWLGEAPHLWLAVDRSLPPNFRLSRFEHVLSESYAFCERTLDLPLLTLDLYARLPPADHTPAVRIGEGIAVDLISPLPAQITDSLPVRLGWSLLDSVPRGVYSYALHIEDAAGNLVAQTDHALPADPFTCQSLTVALGDLPSGSYTLRVVVYEWQTGTRLSAPDDDRPIIGTIEIP